MALPIAPTPILRGKDAERFDARVREDLERPTSAVATPKLENAKLLVREYAERSKKSFSV
jgi:hypothetical protein